MREPSDMPTLLWLEAGIGLAVFAASLTFPVRMNIPSIPSYSRGATYLGEQRTAGLRMYSLVASQGTACFCAVTVCGLNQDIVLGCVIQKLQNSKTVFDMH